MYKKIILIILTLFVSDLTIAQDQSGPPPAPVEVASVQLKDTAQSYPLIGTAEAHLSSDVAAGVEGLVVTCLADEGQHVDKGEILAHLDDQELKFDIQATEALVSELSLKKEQALVHYERSKDLYEKKRLSEEECQDDYFTYKTTEQQHKKYQADLERLKDQLTKKTIKAPFSGIITKRYIEQGQWASKGGILFELIDLSHVHIRCALPEKYFRLIDPLAPALINLKNKKPMTGKIVAVIPQSDPETRSVSVKIKVDNSSQKIHAGQYINVDVFLTTQKQVKLAPKDAIIHKGPQAFVFVVIDGQAQMVPVTIKSYIDSHVEIDGPVKPGSLVVIKGNERLRPGQNVMWQTNN